MRKFLSLSILVVSSTVLAGCVGGTTYGTGVTHEEQTLKGISNIFRLRQKKPAKIEYASRPDLVMPPANSSLPQPLEAEASTSNVDWPETPEQRIARIRGDAVVADIRSGNIPVEEQLRKKDGTRVASASRKKRSVQADRGGNAFIDVLKTGDPEGKEARRRRGQLAYSNSSERKYLTEPPVEYRTPAATAVAGDLGYSDEELEEIKKKEEKEAKARETGLWTE